MSASKAPQSSSSPRVAVITPFFHEPLEMLWQCHQSVISQTFPCTHILVSDGSALNLPKEWEAIKLSLSHPHSDNGNTPRGLGSQLAVQENFTAIAYLDADNWYHPFHIEKMVRLRAESGAAVCSATRNIHRMDGSLMYTDRHGSNGVNHVDTSCLFLGREAFGLTELWTKMPKQLSPICDRVIWSAVLARGLSHAHHTDPTVAFRSRYTVHYANLAELAPEGAKTNEESVVPSYAWWDSQSEDSRTILKNSLNIGSL